ncbi:MAG: hypothetical protein JJU08_11110 [Rhodobacteraceae bacterium]|nr:hypothetical protein [Paracoccaceae bacterium]
MFEKLKTGSHFCATCLSYADAGSYAKKEPVRATPFMARTGGGLIVTGLVVMDRFRVCSAIVFA